MLWAYVGPHSWGYVPIDDHAFGPSEAVLPAEVFQRDSSSRPRRRRIRRGALYALQSRYGTSAATLYFTCFFAFLFLFGVTLNFNQNDAVFVLINYET